MKLVDIPNAAGQLAKLGDETVTIVGPDGHRPVVVVRKVDGSEARVRAEDLTLQ